MKNCDSYWFQLARYFSKQAVLKDSEVLFTEMSAWVLAGKKIHSIWKGFLQRILLLVSAKEKRKTRRQFVSQYELTPGSTQMQFLAEQRLIYVHQIPQDRGYRGCYWQIGHMLAACKGAYVPAGRVAA